MTVKICCEWKGFLVYNEVDICGDRPAYQHRGVMVNSGNSFIEKSLMLRIVDGLSYNKMNVLHWRLADKMNFPLDLDPSIKAWFGHKFPTYYLHFARSVTGNCTRAPNLLIDVTRDLSGVPLVFKRKYNLEKRSKRQYWKNFQLPLELWEITVSFISLYWNIRKTPSVILQYNRHKSNGLNTVHS